MNCECCGAAPHVGACRSAVQLLPGDYVFVASDGFVAWAIRQVERCHFWRRLRHLVHGRVGKAFGQLEGRSYVNHVALVVVAGDLSTAILMDAQPPYVQQRALKAYAGDLVAVYRASGLTDVERFALAQRALRYEGRLYGYGKIALHALGLQGLSFADRWPMCAWTASIPSMEMGIQTSDEPARSASPDSLWDWMNEHEGTERGQFTCVRDLAILRLPRAA